MSKLNIFVCENFCEEFKNIAEKHGLESVAVVSYPSMCENKINCAKTEKILQDNMNDGNDGVILCSKFCDIVKLMPQDKFYQMITSNYCFNHMTSLNIIEYLLKKGGYVIGLGWLNNWREHIKHMGFDQETAIRFFHETCRELVFFDAGIDGDAKNKLEELSGFLNLPYVIINSEMDFTEFMLRSIVSEWKLRKNSIENKNEIAEAQTKCAEYASILNILGKLTTCNNKREAVDKMKDIFMVIMGAKEFSFHCNDFDNNDISDMAEEFLKTGNGKSILLKEQNKFCIFIYQKNKLHGILEAGPFIFPQYIDRYFNFALSISQIFGLVLTNIENYEELLKNKNELEYKSYHDPLTGLFNREYFHKIIDGDMELKKAGVFSFDIDGLKNINDSFGHLEGDKLIVSAGCVLKKSFRETDIVARVGGDEFIAIVPECNKETAEGVKERIEDEINRHNSILNNKHLMLSISIGYELSNNQYNIDELIRRSDAAMYLDKAGKRSLEY